MGKHILFETGIRRLGSKENGFFYRYPGTRESVREERVLERIENLKVPPAWEDARIARSPSAKVQATGYDPAGRLRYRYHGKYRERKEREKVFPHIAQNGPNEVFTHSQRSDNIISFAKIRGEVNRMEKMETKGLNFEELEAQEFGLLPDRVEMRHRRRRRRGTTNTATAIAVVDDSGNSTNLIINDSTFRF